MRKSLPLRRCLIHGLDACRRRFAPAEPKNDGSQTPMRGAPKGCRGCLYKWHGIPEGRELTEKEQEYIVDVLMKWIQRQVQAV